MSLDEIGLKYGTDKASNGHDYLKIYEQQIQPGGAWPTTHQSLLELGWWEGASLRMWREWLPENWAVTGLDIEPKVEIPGVNFIQGDQTSKSVADEANSAWGPFDVIIDDASHISRFTIESFTRYWKHLKPGGLYFIEDLQVSYHRDWGGNPHPDMKGPSGETSMQFLRRLTDMVHYGHAGAGPQFHNVYTDIDHMAFWPGLCMVRKRTV